MSFDKKIDLTAGVYFNFFNIHIYLVWRKSLRAFRDMNSDLPQSLFTGRCSSLWPKVAPPKKNPWRKLPGTAKAIGYGGALSIISVLAQELLSVESAGIWRFGSTL